MTTPPLPKHTRYTKMLFLLTQLIFPQLSVAVVKISHERDLDKVRSAVRPQL